MRGLMSTSFEAATLPCIASLKAARKVCECAPKVRIIGGILVYQLVSPLNDGW